MRRTRRRSPRTILSGVVVSTIFLAPISLIGLGDVAQAAPAHVVPPCSKLAMTVHSTTPGSVLVVYRLVVSNPGPSACKVSGSPVAQPVAGVNHHAVGLPSKVTIIKGANNSPGNLKVSLPAHGTVAHFYATYEIDTQGVVFAMRAKCHAVASNGVRITFPHTSAVVVPLMSYHVCTLAKVTFIGGMAKY